MPRDDGQRYHGKGMVVISVGEVNRGSPPCDELAVTNKRPEHRLGRALVFSGMRLALVAPTRGEIFGRY